LIVRPSRRRLEVGILEGEFGFNKKSNGFIVPVSNHVMIDLNPPHYEISPRRGHIKIGLRDVRSLEESEGMEIYFGKDAGDYILSRRELGDYAGEFGFGRLRV